MHSNSIIDDGNLNMPIQTEQTPDPATLKFVPGFTAI